MDHLISQSGLYNETRFCVAKECNAKNNELTCSFEGKNCNTDSNNKGYKFYYEVICVEGLLNKSGVFGKDVSFVTDFTTISLYHKVSVNFSINSDDIFFILLIYILGYFFYN